MEPRLVLATLSVTVADDYLPGQAPLEGSLRWAIEQSIASPEGDRIEFAIPGDGVQSIRLKSALPYVENVQIDARTQPGYTNSPLVELNGSLISEAADGLTLGDFSSVSGLLITRFSRGAGIRSSGATITENVISHNEYGLIVQGIPGVGEVASQGNTISHNNQSGVLVKSGLWTRILGPYYGAWPDDDVIYANGQLGIDLADDTGTADGVTPNDPRDEDMGPNGLLNYSVLQFASYGGTTVIRGTLSASPASQYGIAFYASEAADPSGHGEGQRFLGTLRGPYGNLDGVVTDYNGFASFEAVLDAATAPGEQITAVTLAQYFDLGYRSEFSAAIPTSAPDRVRANIGGLYSLVEGNSLSLDGSRSVGPDPDRLAYRWDVNGDGSFDENITGPQPTLTWEQLSDIVGPALGSHFRPILEVTDGTSTDSATTVVTVENVALEILSFVGPTSFIDGTLQTFSLQLRDVNKFDPLTVSVDWGDGSPSYLVFNWPKDEIVSGTVTHAFSAGAHTITVWAADDGDSVSTQFDVLVEPSGIVPDAGGPYTLVEGQSLVLDGSASSVPGGASLTYRWDLNGDGLFDENITGVAPALSWQQLMNLSGSQLQFRQFHVGLEVSDGVSSLADPDGAVVNVQNVAPTLLAFEGPTSVSPGAAATYTLRWLEPNHFDSSTVWIAWGDGQYDQRNFFWPKEQVVEWQISHTFSHGNFVISISIADDDGEMVMAEFPVAAAPAALMPDPADPRIRNLLVYGSPGNDVIRATRGRDGQVKVHITGEGNAAYAGSFSPSRRGKIIVYAGAGDDTVRIGADIPHRAEVFGEGGNDRLYGSMGDDLLDGGDGDDLLFGLAGNDVLRGAAGSDIVVGGPGNDRIFGGSGRDLLIGGTGRDVLFGEQGQDLLIGGATRYDENDVALRALLAEWVRPTPMSDRVRNLTRGGGLNGKLILKSRMTVFSDRVHNVLTGGEAADWFFALGGNHKLDFRPPDISAER